jgi:hypothetical protein
MTGDRFNDHERLALDPGVPDLDSIEAALADTASTPRRQ